MTGTSPEYVVRVLDDQPIHKRIEALEDMVENSASAEAKLMTILEKFARLALNPYENSICICQKAIEKLFISFHNDATFYFVLRDHKVYPVGVVFDSDYDSTGPRNRSTEAQRPVLSDLVRGWLREGGDGKGTRDLLLNILGELARSNSTPTIIHGEPNPKSVIITVSIDGTMTINGYYVTPRPHSPPVRAFGDGVFLCWSKSRISVRTEGCGRTYVPADGNHRSIALLKGQRRGVSSVASHSEERMALLIGSIVELTVNTIRTLCIDVVQEANSGHPDTPIAMAPVMYQFLRFDPDEPIWPNRDRFMIFLKNGSVRDDDRYSLRSSLCCEIAVALNSSDEGCTGLASTGDDDIAGGSPGCLVVTPHAGSAITGTGCQPSVTSGRNRGVVSGPDRKGTDSRDSSGQLFNKIAPNIPWLIGGAAGQDDNRRLAEVLIVGAAASSAARFHTHVA